MPYMQLFQEMQGPTFMCEYVPVRVPNLPSTIGVTALVQSS